MIRAHVIGKQEQDGSTTYTNCATGDVACIMPTRFNCWLIMSNEAHITEEPFNSRLAAIEAIEARWS